jgi:4-hydroxybenzoate polyprenyltransferase
VDPIIFIILLAYIINNLAYSFYIKNIILLDAFSISLGFVLRVVAGAEAIQVEISTWIILCTILGSLFLAFSKRRSELSLQGDKAVNHRASLAEYSQYFLDQMIGVVTASTVMAYALWTMWPSVTEKFETKHLPWTIPFVCYAIFRYLYLVHQKGEGGNPTRLFLSDWPLLVDIALWMTSVILILYLEI